MPKKKKPNLVKRLYKKFKRKNPEKTKKVTAVVKKTTVIKKTMRGKKSVYNRALRKTSSKQKAANLSKRKAENESWKRASVSAKKSGTTISALVQSRKKYKKGSKEYNVIQNRINKAYGVKKRHGKPVQPLSKSRTQAAAMIAKNKKKNKKVNKVPKKADMNMRKDVNMKKTVAASKKRDTKVRDKTLKDIESFDKKKPKKKTPDKKKYNVSYKKYVARIKKKYKTK